MRNPTGNPELAADKDVRERNAEVRNEDEVGMNARAAHLTGNKAATAEPSKEREAWKTGVSAKRRVEEESGSIPK